MTNSNGRLKDFLAISTTAIASEHFFTFSLSSLPTTKKFFSDSPEGKEEVREAYKIATGLSLGLAGIMSYVLKSWKPLITTVVLSGIFIALYERALKSPEQLTGEERRMIGE